MRFEQPVEPLSQLQSNWKQEATISGLAGNDEIERPLG
jgi:hypothetical protein